MKFVAPGPSFPRYQYRHSRYLSVIPAQAGIQREDDGAGCLFTLRGFPPSRE